MRQTLRQKRPSSELKEKPVFLRMVESPALTLHTTFYLKGKREKTKFTALLKIPFLSRASSGFCRTD